MPEINLLVITPVHHIEGVVPVLERIGRVSYLEDASQDEVLRAVGHHDAIFTNPNKSNVFIGRQLDHLTAGVIGYGRLGSRFARYAQPMFKKVLACDPYVDIHDNGVEQVDLDRLLRECDVISVHTHVTPETTRMLDRTALE